MHDQWEPMSPNEKFRGKKFSKLLTRGQHSGQLQPKIIKFSKRGSRKGKNGDFQKSLKPMDTYNLEEESVRVDFDSSDENDGKSNDQLFTGSQSRSQFYKKFKSK